MMSFLTYWTGKPAKTGLSELQEAAVVVTELVTANRSIVEPIALKRSDCCVITLNARRARHKFHIVGLKQGYVISNVIKSKKLNVIASKTFTGS